MKKDFESRFMPDVRFKIPTECIKKFNFGLIDASYAITSTDGGFISHVFTNSEKYLFNNFSDTHIVSIYEAIPELVPDGMRYNKELDKLVPDVIEDTKQDFIVKIPTVDEAIRAGVLGKPFSINEWINSTLYIPDSDEHLISMGIDPEKVKQDRIEYHKLYDEYINGIDLKKEIVNERENGFIKADLEKLDFSLVDPFAYSDLAFQLTIGAKKYSKNNWKKGDINIYLSALERHIQDIKKALDEDDIESLIDDTGIQHGGALLCNSMFIHYFIRQILKDKKC